MEHSKTQWHRVVDRDCESNLKRPLSSDSIEEDDSKQRKIEREDGNQCNNDVIPLFLLIKSKEESKTLSKISPFVINKAIVGVGGEPTSIKKLRDGTVLVEAANSVQARKILKLTSLFDRAEVVVEPHGTLNSSKGIVFSRELLECDLDEVKEELRACHVIDVVRISRMEGTKQVPTAGHILTFGLPHPPESIKAGYLVLSVRPYFRNPQRCFKCQKFGHSSKDCKNKEMCVNCAKEDHNDKTCELEPLCVNCRGKHPASSKSCKTYLEEKEVIKIATVNKLSFVDARREYRRRTAQPPRQDVSYAQAAASTSRVVPSCSNCSSLEAMVRALTEQMANVISLLSANVSSQPRVQTKPHAEKSKVCPQVEGQKALYLKTDRPPGSTDLQHPTTKPKTLSTETRKVLSDKLRQTIKSKSDTRTLGPAKTSANASQSSIVEEDMLRDELQLQSEFQTVTGRFKPPPTSKLKKHITFSK